jgi:asparaginyl-tRNA synthetase
MTISISEIFKSPASFLGQSLAINGRIRTIRDSKTFGFIELNDGSYFKNLQIVFDDTLPNFEEVCKLGISSSLTIEGEVVESPGAKQPFELKAANITIVGASPADYPLQKKGHSLEYLRTIAHLRPRTNTFSATFRVRSLLAYAIHKYFNEHGFIYAHTPIITASDAEGAGQMFQVTTLDLERVARETAEKPDYNADFF